MIVSSRVVLGAARGEAQGRMKGMPMRIHPLWALSLLANVVLMFALLRCGGVF